jgi:hypothetical protein
MSDTHFVVMRHPELDDSDPVSVHASAFPAHALRGWVEVVAKSSKASAADEYSTPTVGATTSKEDRK